MTRAVAIVQRFEGCKLSAYPDATGIWTIGYGHTPSRDGQIITQNKADQLLEADLAKAFSYVQTYVKVPLTPAMYDALASFVFNVGARAFLDSTLLGRVNASEYLDVPAQLLRWVHAGPKVLLGLVRRRIAEAALFLEDGLPDGHVS